MNIFHFYNKEEKQSFCKDFLVKETLSPPALVFPPVFRGWFFMDTVDGYADTGKHDEAPPGNLSLPTLPAFLLTPTLDVSP